MTRPDPRPRFPVALAVALSSLVLIAAAVAAQSPAPRSSTGPDTPVSSSPMTPGQPDTGSGATIAVPQDGLSDIHRAFWEHVDVAANGQQLTVYYWSGVDTCYGLASVDAQWVHGTLDIRLWTGTLPGVGACIDMAQLYKTVVQLDQQLITGGHLEL